MNLFRSEEHARRWLEQRGYDGGETIGIEQLADLAYAFYGNRLAPDWRPRTRDETQAIVDSVGLTGPFWRYP
jgi:hypothetical protein